MIVFLDYVTFISHKFKYIRRKFLIVAHYCFRVLDGNTISGGIPEALGNISSLTILNLGNNIFNGSIPDSLGRLQKLQIL